MNIPPWLPHLKEEVRVGVRVSVRVRFRISLRVRFS